MLRTIILILVICCSIVGGGTLTPSTAKAINPPARPAVVSTVVADGAFPLARNGRPASLIVDAGDWSGVLRVAALLQSDLEEVVGQRPDLDQVEAGQQISRGEPAVLIGTVDRGGLIDELIAAGKFDASDLRGKNEKFIIEAVSNPLAGIEQALVIAGSDKRGTIYGMFDLAEQAGVSPWNWWADVPAPRQHNLYVLPGRHTLGEPAIKYRGIFINDEAPALAGWVHERYGAFNHEFYEKVFELILRLKGNFLWPAMWGRSIYDDDPRSPQLADEYGVVIGTSHHEPMLRAHVDWARYGKGPWNFQTNEDALLEFWRTGIERMGSNESMVTVGMRGDGDEPMSEQANIELLERIIAAQRKIIADVTGKPPEETPQMWALYKEVQEYYDRGMRVPDDVMLLLCDDNWGNIRKLPALDEPRRAGGYGVYYHFDYVGGPRNYKWLNTNQIARVWQQMHLAWRHGADRLWIVNVGDIKPMEYPTQFFLDYAWDPDAWPAERLPEYARRWAAAQFPEHYATDVADILTAYTKYNSRRKPELLAPDTYSHINFDEAQRVAADYRRLAAKAERIAEELPAEYRDSYFQLVLHPVLACSNLYDLYLAAGRNRLYASQGRMAANEEAQRVRQLFQRDAEISQRYNDQIAGGKWRHMMDQTHIGYTSWQEPPQNVMPRVETVDGPEAAEMGVAIEGSSESWPSAESPAQLPEIYQFGRARSRWFEVFNRGRTPFECRIECDADWLLLSDRRAEIELQQRFTVEVDWDKAAHGKNEGVIAVAGPDDTSVTVHVVAVKPDADEAARIAGFVEANGHIAIEAEHYARAVGKAPIRWQTIPNLGRTLSGVAPTPVTSPPQTPGRDSPHLQYRIYVRTAGEVQVSAYVSPTIDYTAGDGLEYAVSIDDAPPQVVNTNADQSLQAWERQVAANINISTSTHSIAEPGEHVLKFWMVDPGVVLQRLVVETSGAPASYLGPSESVYKQPREPH